MATHVWKQPFLPLFVCSFFSVFAETGRKEYLRREHTLTKPYQEAAVSMPNWDFSGSTMVTSQFVRLTPNQQGQQGAIWNNVVCMVPNWEIQVEFKIHGATKTLFGDGMAFWYTKERMESGPVFGSREPFTGLGLFLDTYSNYNKPHDHQHPYISAMINDGTLGYDHDTDGTHSEIAGCETQVRNKNYETHIAIRYEGNTLKVLLDVDKKKEWEECFSVDEVKLPVGYYFGVSAATGELADNHDIISIKFYELEPKDENEPLYSGLPQAPPVEPLPDETEEEEKEEDKNVHSEWKLLLNVLCVVGGFSTIGVVAVVVLHKNREIAKKKFY